MIHTHFFEKYNITLVRVFVHQADEVGTLEKWEQHIASLFWQHPFHSYWQDTLIKACNVAAPECPQELIDYDRNTPGFQVAAGLDPYGKEVWLSFIPDNWQPGQSGPTQINPSTIQMRMTTLSHEMGHQFAQYAGYGQSDTAFKRSLTALFNAIRPKQGHNEGEDWAEVYRAVMGADNVRGTFSDNKRFDSTALRSLLRCAWYLNQIIGKTEIKNLTTYGDYVQWVEPVWFWQNCYRLNCNNWRKEKLTRDVWEIQ